MYDYQRDTVSSIFVFVGVIIIILGIFSDILDLGISLAIGIYIFFISGAIYRLIDDQTPKNERIRETITILLSGLGTITLIISIFNPFNNLDFGVGLAISLSFFFIAGTLNNYLSNVNKRNNAHFQIEEKIGKEEVFIKKDDKFVKKSTLAFKCPSCGSILDNADKYCFKCGTPIK